MKHISVVLFAVSFVFLFSSCEKKEGIKVEITNNLNFERNDEVVKLSNENIVLTDGSRWQDYGVVDAQGNLQLLQYLDENLDKVIDGVLFQPSVSANQSAVYYLRKLKAGEANPQNENTCFSRFVPERTDDYAWENDKVAFRVFGPTAQEMKEDGVEGGTLSSGIDCWLKKVEYPIIDKWYAKHVSGEGSYHVDSGEGLDNFHVGISQGCGGLAVKTAAGYRVSKNFTAFKPMANGYLQTSFALDYAPWKIDSAHEIYTRKSLSLDRGSNLTRIEVTVDSLDVISAGLTLHENDGKVTIDSLGGWISYWQPHGDSFLGTAIIASPGTFVGAEKLVSAQADLSNVYVHLSVEDHKTVYYSGFFWQKSGQFAGRKEWEKYLAKYAAQLRSPLTVHVKVD